MSSSWDTKPHPAYNYYGTGNVEEVIPGVIKPLSADLVMAVSNEWARRLCDSVGVRDQVQYLPLPFDNIFAIVSGRVAVNIGWLGAFVGTYQVGAGSDMLSQFLQGDAEGMKSDVSADTARAIKTRKAVEALWAKAPAKAAKEVVKVERVRRASLDAKKVAKAASEALVDLVEANILLCGELFLRHSQTTMPGGEYTGQLAAFLDAHAPGHPPEWTTSLTSALGGVVSSEPIERIWALTQTVRKLKPVATAFKSGSLDAVREGLARGGDDAWLTFGSELDAFISAYGFRGQGELDPSTPDWGEDQTFVLSAIRTNLGVPASRDPAKREAKAMAARAKLEAQVEKRLPLDQRAAFRDLLEQTQRFVRARELTKANLARGTRAFRPWVQELGRRLAAEGALVAPDDVWMLRLTELRDAVAAKVTARTLKGRVTKRAAERTALRGMEIPLVFTLPVDATPIAKPAEAATRFTGLAVSPGVATGRARIILSASAEAETSIGEGEVLVAPFTDAAWTPLFWPAAAVVVERGGMLSHASTVAREFGIPAVVGVINATQLIAEGAIVTVDGNLGTVSVA